MFDVEDIKFSSSNADLHTHSVFSDGQMSVGMLIKEALKNGIRYLSITDHENVFQYNEVLELFKYSNIEIEVLPGLEVSTSFNGEDIHLVVYFNKANLKEVAEFIAPLREEKIKNTCNIIQLMIDSGFKIDKHTLKSDKRTMNRLYIARYICSNYDHSSLEEVFIKYFEKDSRFNIKSYVPHTDEVIQKFSNIGCFIGVAHPDFLKDWSKIKYIEHFIKHGLNGIEVFHPIINKDLRERILNFSVENGLIPLGGSDFHGYDTKRKELGVFKTFDKSFLAIKKFIEM
ncbi:MAG: PHP domain-containing protein [Brevinematia bacterium]